MGPARPRPPAAPQLLLLLLFLLCFPRALWGDVVFLPPFIRMFDTSVTAALVGDTENVSVTLTLGDDALGILPMPDCGLQSNGTGNWSLTVTPHVRGSEVTVRLDGDLQPCVPETDFFSEYPCIVETLLVSASHNSSCLAHLLIQVEIYPNTSFAQNVSGFATSKRENRTKKKMKRKTGENATIIPNQVYQPLGPCPCDLFIGACDVQCCCDQDCTPHLKDLFREHCFTGVFGGNVNPPFDHLCSTPVTEEVSDLFPFLCVQSSLENTPFLGYFYHGSISPRTEHTFRVPRHSSSTSWLDLGYWQDRPIVTSKNEFFTIPQVSLVGQCVQKAPVAFLRNFDSNCATNLTTYQERENISEVRLINSIGEDWIVPQVVYEESTALNKFIYDTETILHPGPTFKLVHLEEHYTFRWKENKITELNVRIIWAKIHADQQGILTQRFKVTFLTFNATEGLKRSGNPGYHPGKPVRVLNVASADNVSTINLWRPVGSGLCTEVETSPVLFGEDAVSGCLWEVAIDENCTHLRAEVMNRLKSLVQATHVAKKGNADYGNIHDGWLKIIWRDTHFPQEGPYFMDIKGICPDVPSMMTVHFLISNSGNLEGIPQDVILGAEVSFSSVTWQFHCGITCEDKPSFFPLSVSVQFIRIPPQLTQPLTSFQISLANRDCTNNEVCWSELIFPLSKNYQGEYHYSCLAKSLMLIFIFSLIIFIRNPWIREHMVWGLSAF
ncbi:tectonic-2 isoform X1 [Antechinus flavipes]|uniref:tectonic-2 isoform X1 n=1 Tax=Antechinus flavipes TaxID=38775 RepID=UPI002235518A|nr:tectonic-2 isoform X1 [Antechinus flavipes]